MNSKFNEPRETAKSLVLRNLDVLFAAVVYGIILNIWNALPQGLMAGTDGLLFGSGAHTLRPGAWSRRFDGRWRNH